MGPAVALALGVAACVSSGPVQVLPVLGGDAVEIRGRYLFEDGDRFVYACGQAKPCEITLVRDARLQRLLERHGSFAMVVTARRVDACKSLESKVYACLTSSDGTALLVEKWLRPAAGS